MFSYLKSYLWLPALIGLLVYLPSLQFKAPWGDDTFVINQYSTNLNLLIKSFYTSVPGLHFVPFCFLQSYLINILFGEYAYPFGFHLYQLSLHVIACILLAIIIYKLTRHAALTILLVIIWTVHPINVEVITRLGNGPAQVFAGVSCLVFILCVLCAREVSNNRTKLLFVLFGILFFFVSLLSYEQYFLFPLLIILLLYHFEGKNLFTNRANLLIFVAPLICSFGAFILWKLFVYKGSLFDTSTHLITWTGFGNLSDVLFRAFWLLPQLVVHYLRLFFYPNYLAESKADWYYLSDSLWGPYYIFCSFVVLFLLFSAIFLYKKIPLYSIGIAWFFISMILVLQIIPLFTIVDEHYCYLASAGLLLSLSGLVAEYKTQRFNKILIAACISIIVVLIWRTELYLPAGKDLFNQSVYLASQASDWSKPILYAKAIETAKSLNRENELPEWLNDTSLTKSINNWLEKYLELKPSLYFQYGPFQMAYNYYTFGFIFKFLFYSGQNENLNKAIDTALKLRSDWLGYYEAGKFLQFIEKWELAWQMYKTAVYKNPGFESLYNTDLVIVAIKVEQYNELAEIIKKYIEQNPRHSYPYLFCGLFYKQLNDTDNALRFFKEGISTDKQVSVDKDGIYYYAATNFEENEMHEEAIQALKILLSFDPQNKKALELLSRIKAMTR